MWKCKARRDAQDSQCCLFTSGSPRRPWVRVLFVQLECMVLELTQNCTMTFRCAWHSYQKPCSDRREEIENNLLCSTLRHSVSWTVWSLKWGEWIVIVTAALLEFSKKQSLAPVEKRWFYRPKKEVQSDKEKKARENFAPELYQQMLKYDWKAGKRGKNGVEGSGDQNIWQSLAWVGDYRRWKSLKDSNSARIHTWWWVIMMMIIIVKRW